MLRFGLFNRSKFMNEIQWTGLNKAVYYQKITSNSYFIFHIFFLFRPYFIYFLFRLVQYFFMQRTKN